MALTFGNQLTLINGSFKMTLQRTKEEYLNSKFGLKHSFLQTDVIPILNKAWGKSIGQKDKARKAILDRGWLVLNYTLLDDDRLLCNETPTNPIIHRQPMIDVANLAQQINTTGPFFNSVLDHLIADEAKAEGRKRKWEEQQKEEQTVLAQFTKLRKLGNIKSGKLAANNHFIYDEILRYVLQEQQNERKMEQEAKDVEKVQRKEIAELKLKKAGDKFNLGQPLTKEDMVILMGKIPKETGDSPVKTKAKQPVVLEQFNRRRDRVVAYLDPLRAIGNRQNIMREEDGATNNGNTYCVGVGDDSNNNNSEGVVAL
jgi:hypothetical protein